VLQGIPDILPTFRNAAFSTRFCSLPLTIYWARWPGCGLFSGSWGQPGGENAGFPQRGDFGSFLIGAPHEYALTAEQLELRTDGHMDIDAVRPGALLLAPVKIPGAGLIWAICMRSREMAKSPVTPWMSPGQ